MFPLSSMSSFSSSSDDELSDFGLFNRLSFLPLGIVFSLFHANLNLNLIDFDVVISWQMHIKGTTMFTQTQLRNVSQNFRRWTGDAID